MSIARPIVVSAIFLLLPFAKLRAQDEMFRQFSMYAGVTGGAPVRAFDEGYNRGWGIEGYAVNWWGPVAVTGAFGWSRFPGEEVPPPDGPVPTLPAQPSVIALTLPPVELYSATAGVRLYLGPAHLGAEGGYFWSNLADAEWSARAAAGLTLGPFDLTARYKPWGELSWISLTAGLELVRLGFGG